HHSHTPLPPPRSPGRSGTHHRHLGPPRCFRGPIRGRTPPPPRLLRAGPRLSRDRGCRALDSLRGGARRQRHPARHAARERPHVTGRLTASAPPARVGPAPSPSSWPRPPP